MGYNNRCNITPVMKGAKMPPKAKFTKTDIVNTAFEMVRNHGADIISARNVAVALGTSTAPIFTAFDSIESLILAAKEKTVRFYRENYLDEALREELPFKAAGRNYVKFAKEEPELFKFIFMAEGDDQPTSHYLPAGDPTSGDVLGAFVGNYDIDNDEARYIYNHMSVYTYGLAVLFARGCCVFTMEDVNRMMSEVFLALKAEVTRKNG